MQVSLVSLSCGCVLVVDDADDEDRVEIVSADEEEVIISDAAEVEEEVVV